MSLEYCEHSLEGKLNRPNISLLLEFYRIYAESCRNRNREFNTSSIVCVRCVWETVDFRCEPDVPVFGLSVAIQANVPPKSNLFDFSFAKMGR